MQPQLFEFKTSSANASLHRPLREVPAHYTPGHHLYHAGPSATSTAELLAVLLGKGQGPHGATQFAEQLLAEFGSLPGLFRASIDDLTAITGIGQATANKLVAALELARRAHTTQLDQVQIRTGSDVVNLLMPDMAILQHEELRVVMLNTRHFVQKIETIYKGSLNAAAVRIAELFRPAVKLQSASIILAHNHPSGDPSPSPEDVRLSELIIEAGALLGIELLDHVVIGHNRFVSMKERGLAFK